MRKNWETIFNLIISWTYWLYLLLLRADRKVERPNSDTQYELIVFSCVTSQKDLISKHPASDCTSSPNLSGRIVFYQLEDKFSVTFNLTSIIHWEINKKIK